MLSQALRNRRRRSPVAVTNQRLAGVYKTTKQSLKGARDSGEPESNAKQRSGKPVQKGEKLKCLAQNSCREAEVVMSKAAQSGKCGESLRTKARRTQRKETG
jgi:hypothetical protein